MKAEVAVYGRWESHRSIPKVCRNMAKTLGAYGFTVYAWSADTPHLYPERLPLTDRVFRVGHTAARSVVLYKDMPDNIQIDLKYRRHVPATSFSLPDHLSGWMTPHARRYPGFVCETLDLPPERTAGLNMHTAVWVPSYYCMDTLLAMKVSAPIHVIHHGVEPEFHPIDNFNERPFTFLLLNTVGPFHHRKGIVDGALAFHAAFEKEKDVRLLVRSPMLSDLRAELEAVGDDRIVIQEPAGMAVSAAAMNQLYNSVDVLFAPSRGEGFALPALEAKAAGVPVVGTFWHGAKEHYMPEVDTAIQPSKRMTTTDIGEMQGTVYDLDRDAIVDALRHAYEKHDELKRKALAASPRVRAEWSWPAKLRPLKELLLDGTR